MSVLAPTLCFLLLRSRGAPWNKKGIFLPQITTQSLPPSLSLSLRCDIQSLVSPLQGVMSRVYEAVIVLILVGLLVLGTVWVADALTLQLNTTSSTSDNFATVRALYDYMVNFV